MMSNAELNAIIESGRPVLNERFESDDLLQYFDAGRVNPSYMYMDRTRMIEILNRALKASWCNANHERLIQNALKRIG